MDLHLLERQSPAVAGVGSEPQPWPSGTASMKRAATKRCRWTRLCAGSWIGAGQITSRSLKRPCLGSRCAASWGCQEARSPLPAGGAGRPDRNPALVGQPRARPGAGFRSSHRRSGARQSQPPCTRVVSEGVARAVPLSASGWRHPIAGSGPCLSAPGLAADAALLHASWVRPRGPDGWPRHLLAAPVACHCKRWAPNC